MYGNPLERRAKAPTADVSELSERYEYTAEGLLKSAISRSGMGDAAIGMRYSYTYDSMGRLEKKCASGRTLLSFAYDLNGNLTRQTDVTGKTTEYRYDLIDQVCEVWDNGKRVAGYEYNPDGTVRNLSCGGLYTEYGYDADRSLTSLRTMLGSEVLADNHYRYDGNGRRVEKRQIQGLTTYTYDSMNRLSAVEYPGQKEELFYDRAGNRTRRICGGEEELYQYDSRNRLTAYTKGDETREFKYDNAGNLLEDGRARYEYDAFNRNTKAEAFDGNVQINRYDAEGLRHEMEENGKLVSFIFRGREAVAEESGEDKIRYIRTGELLASGAEYARTYYHYASDEMGSITHVVTGQGEESAESGEVPGGSVLNRYEYDAWGNLAVCEETVENRFKFNGQQYDPVTQQYYLRARYYNPVIGRFTQEDTYRGDGLNLYAYCRNNPVYYVDSSGHAAMSCRRAREIMKSAIREGMTLQTMDAAVVASLKLWFDNKANHGRLSNVEIDLAKQIGLANSTYGGRIIPGTAGVVTGGNSTRLGRNMMESMGLPRGTRWTGYQAQHIIPAELINHPILQRIGMDLDDASNGLFLRTRGDDVSAMSRHGGDHSIYNDFVRMQLDGMDINQNIDVLQNQVYNLQQNLISLQQNGLPLYPGLGGTVDLWQRNLERIQ